MASELNNLHAAESSGRERHEQSSVAETEVASPEPRQPKNIPFWRVVISVLQASFGVQNPENRERDFGHGKALPFIVAAVLFTGLFVLALMLVVNLVLSRAV